MAGVVAGAVLLVLVGILGFFFPSYWPLPIAAGAVLVGASLVRSRPRSPVYSQGETMHLPEAWDEQEITRGLELYRTDSGLLGRYVDGVVSRFVMGQDMRTMEVRARFLEKFNQYAEIARESYKWHRYLKGDRAKLEEDAADLRAKLEVARAQKDLDTLSEGKDLAELQRKIDRLELELKIATAEKAIADLNRPAPPPPPAPPSPHELRERKKADLARREKEILQAIRETEADTSLDEEVRQRKLNALNDRLAEIHAEQAKLL